MAEGTLQSLQDRSIADINIVCTPCWEGNVREEAVQYCPECQEYLCTSCTIHHGRLKATRSHKLQASSGVKQGSMVSMTTKCKTHPDQDIEIYCGKHDMVYCTECISKEHRSCNGVVDVKDVKPSASTNCEIQRLQTDLNNLQDRLVHIDKKTQKNIVSLERQRSRIADRIVKEEQKLIEHVRKLKHKTANNLKEEYVEIMNELESAASVIDDTTKEIEKSSKTIESLPNTNAQQQFIQTRLIQNILHKTGKLLAEREAYGVKSVCFTENTELKSSIMTLTSLGRIHTDTEREQIRSQQFFKVKSMKEIKVNMNNDQSDCNISDICQLPDDTIILTDDFNKKIKRLDMNYNIKDHCDLDDQPLGICYTGQKEVAVKMFNNTVQFISVGSSLTKLRQISIKNGNFWGIAYCAGDLWLSAGSNVNVYSISGTLLKTISKYAYGQKVFKKSTRHMAVSGETVIVTDDSNGAVCLGKDGTVRGELRDDRLNLTTGVCVSGDGIVFLSGFSSNNIVMFDKNGKSLGELVASGVELDKPVSLSYDDMRNCLTVTCFCSNRIMIFDISG